MKILVINCGSSSLKYQVFDMSSEKTLAKGIVERIGNSNSSIHHEKINSKEGLRESIIEKEINNHKEGILLVVYYLTHSKEGCLNSLEDIRAVGHRIVHGGEKFADSVIINDKVLEELKSCKELAPLHNPPNIIGIEAAREIFKKSVQVGVFDTAFHQTIEKKCYLYGLPYELYEKYGVRKYGFHGTSHKYVAYRAASILNQPLKSLKLITCHLGNGASITAVDGGESVDTSMGFTPLEGLVMGTRSGNIDPAITTFLQEKENMNPEEANVLLNEKSGVLGISKLSNDFRDLELAASKGDKNAALALEVFIYRVVKFIGSYIMVLGGVDGLVFTAGVGENSPYIRKKIVEYLKHAGILIDEEKNNVRGEEENISAHDSNCEVLVIPTKEELMIAKETAKSAQL